MVTAAASPAVEPVYARKTAVNRPAFIGVPETTSSFAPLSNVQLTPAGSEPENFFTAVASVALSSSFMRVSAIGM